MWLGCVAFIMCGFSLSVLAGVNNGGKTDQNQDVGVFYFVSSEVPYRRIAE
ncbi:hypothetical protein [Pedobacter sp. L105]|uniref:hypothetical protein n=1 Tax=Pedobacter sp. L105 TaxID=1641871 RepID=UPI00131CF306|nr:hypothetical protein [Pedobacter sp. L105]